MSNLDCWPVSCCLIGLDGRGWLSISMTQTQPQQPGTSSTTSSSSSSNWSPVRSHAAVATASHSEPTPSRTRAWTTRPKLIPVVFSGLEVRSQHLHHQNSGFSAPALWVPEFSPRLWTLGDGKRSPPQIVTLPPTKTCSSYRPSIAFHCLVKCCVCI